MDKEILKTLSDFLPSEVIDEIAITNNLKIEKVNIKSNNNKHSIFNENKERNNTNTNDGKEKEKKNNSNIEKDNIVYSNNNNFLNFEENKIENDKKNHGEKKINLNLPILKVPPKRYENIFEYLKNSSFRTKINLKGDNITYGFNNFNTNHDLSTLDISYFVTPLSITQIKYLLDFYDEVKDILKGKDSTKFLPFPLKSGHKNNILGEYEEVRKLFNLVYILLNGVGKEVIFENYEYNNYQLGKIEKSLLKNPEFFKNFLVKEKSNIKISSISLNTRKNAFLKFHLKKLEKSLVNNRSKSLINFINNVLLKDVKAKKYNINVSNHKLLQKIFSITLGIINGNIGLFKALIENANITFEVRLLKELLLYGNLDDYEEIITDTKNNENKTKIKDNFEENTQDKTYRIYDFSLFSELYSKKNGLKNLINDKINNELLKKGCYITKGGIFYYKNSLIKNKNESEIKNIVLKEFTQEIFSINIKEEIINQLDVKKDKDKINNLNNFKLSYQIGFLREDDIICAQNKTATFPLKRLDKDNYKIEISFGGNTNIFNKHKCIYIDNCNYIKNNPKYIKNCENHNLICQGISNIIKKSGETHNEILKNLIDQKTGLTPDFIIKIKKGEENIGNIIIDAKFSKFGYIYNGEIDYNPWMGNFEELKKYFSYNKSIYEKGNLPTKVIILYPGDQKFSKSNFGKQINDYFERVNGIVALPLSLGDNKFENLKVIFEYIEKYINFYIK